VAAAWEDFTAAVAVSMAVVLVLVLDMDQALTVPVVPTAHAGIRIAITDTGVRTAIVAVMVGADMDGEAGTGGVTHDTVGDLVSDGRIGVGDGVTHTGMRMFLRIITPHIPTQTIAPRDTHARLTRTMTRHRPTRMMTPGPVPHQNRETVLRSRGDLRKTLLIRAMTAEM
jgi:hypothetical protein